jgi:Flp pilus assembly protein TadG
VTRSHAARGRGERGSALVEFVWLVVLLMVPLVYLLLAVFDVQRASYGAAAASRAAGRAFVLAPDQQTAQLRAAAAARVALTDQDVDWSAAAVRITCSPQPSQCLTPGSTVTVAVTVQQPVPLVPDALGSSGPTVRVSSSHVEPYGTFREARP